MTIFISIRNLSIGHYKYYHALIFLKKFPGSCPVDLRVEFTHRFSEAVKLQQKYVISVRLDMESVDLGHFYQNQTNKQLIKRIH